MHSGLLSAATPGVRKIRVIAPAAFLNSLSVGYVNLGMIFAVKEVFSASPSMVGWFGALWSVAYFCGCVFFRGITSRLVPRVSMLLALFVSFLSLAIFSFFPSLPAAFVVYGILGAATALYWPPLMGWLSRGLEGTDLSKAGGVYNFSWSLAGIVSPYLAGAMSQANKFLPVYAAMGTYFLTGVFLLVSRRFLRDPEERPAPIGDRPRESDFSTPLRFPAWAGVFVLYAAIGILANIFPLFARDAIGMSESDTGFMMTIRAAASMAGFAFFGKTAFWRFRKKLLVLPLILGCAFSVLLALSGTSVLFLGIGLVGIGVSSAWAYNNSMFYGASGDPDATAG